jgi:succinyl-diaminopimelate desuccinylase
VTPEEGGALTTLAEMLSQLGFCNDRVTFSDDATPDVENLYSRLGSDGPHLMFAGHTDVVPVGDAGCLDAGSVRGRDCRWRNVWPRRGRHEGRHRLFRFGAGAADRAQGAPEGSVSLLITGDEEGPSINGTEKLLAHARDKGETWDAAWLASRPTPISWAT